MTGPRPIPDPEPVVWGTVLVTVIAAGLIGGAAGWLMSRRWGP